MPDSNIVYRQSAQVISSITDLSQIDTTPDYAFFGCVTASKGELNTPYLIPEGNLTLLENTFGEVSARHTTLLAAARAVNAGVAAYLVRVAGKSVASSKLSLNDTDGTAQVSLAIKEPGTDGDNYSVIIAEEQNTIDPGTQEVQVRPNGPAGEESDFDYATAYKNAGVSYANNVIRYIKKEPVNIDQKLFHDVNAFIGLTFPKPAGATAVTASINGSQAVVDLDLTRDSDDVYNGNLIVYFAFADAAGNPLNDSSWEIQFTWQTPTGVQNTYTTIYRESGEEVKSYKLSLYRNNLVMEEISVSTAEDSDNYILDAYSDYFTIEGVGDVAGKELALGAFKFTGGNDGVSDITYQDFVGEKTPGGYTGVYCFLDNRLAGQMIASLGFTDKNYAMAMKDVADTRKDLTVIVDSPSGLTFNQVRNWINNEGTYTGDLTLEGFNMELYWDWEKDVWNGEDVVVPPSSYVVENSLKSYRANRPWYPVAGDERGVISATGVVTRIDEVTDRDTLVSNRINPIHDTGIRGIQIYGNETLNGEYSDLSAAHIARTLTYIRSTVDNYTETLKFELNDDVLWSTWVDYVENKILAPIQTGRGLQWYRATMGEALTTREELAQRKVRGAVELQFTPDAEIFILEYVVYASSEDMSAEEE